MSVLNVSGWSYFRDLIAVLEKKIKDNGVNEKHPVLYAHSHIGEAKTDRKKYTSSVYPHEFSMKLAHTLQPYVYPQRLLLLYEVCVDEFEIVETINSIILDSLYMQLRFIFLSTSDFFQLPFDWYVDN